MPINVYRPVVANLIFAIALVQPLFAQEGQLLYIGYGSGLTSFTTNSFNGGTYYYAGTWVGGGPNSGTYTNSNSALIVWGLGTVISTGDLRIGENGGRQNLVQVSDGAQLWANNTHHGAGLPPGASNAVVVVGNGTVWSNSGNFNMRGNNGILLISNGGSLVNSNLYIGGSSSYSRSNTVTVTGTNSVLSNAGVLNVGNAQSHNVLIVSNGAKVTSLAGNVGVQSQAATARSNAATITGAASLWTNAGLIKVWGDGSLTVANQGRVLASEIVISSFSVLNVGSADTNQVAGFVDSPSIVLENGSVKFGQTDQVTFSPSISGDGRIEQIGSGVTILSGSNSYTGGALVSKGVLRLAPEGILAFKATINGVVGGLTNNAQCQLQGTFNIDLSSAGTNRGDSWAVVTNGVGASTIYSPSFKLSGFATTSQGVWHRKTNDVLYRYSQSNSTLSVVGSTRNDFDNDGLNDAAEILLQDLGFNWEVPQNDLVTLFLANTSLFTQSQLDGNRTNGQADVIMNPSAFNLFTQSQFNGNRTVGQQDVVANPIAYGLYDSNSIMDLRMGGLMLQKQGTNATVVFETQTTTDLTQPFTNNGTPITNTVPMSGNKGFLRIQAR